MNVKEATAPPAKFTHGVYEITFTAKNISNDSVGEDWAVIYTYNDQVIRSGWQVTQSLEIFSFQSIRVEIRENDKIDDVGNGFLTVPFVDGASATTTITVVEQGGRYDGNIAVWEVTCLVRLIEKIIVL
jgi:hypothetical protein